MSSCKFLIFYLDLKCNWVKHFTGEGVQVAVSSFKKDAEVNEVDYCGYVELRRPIFKKDHTFITGEFDLLTPSGQTGVSYSLPRSLENDTNQTTPWSSIYTRDSQFKFVSFILEWCLFQGFWLGELKNMWLGFNMYRNFSNGRRRKWKWKSMFLIGMS